MKCPVCNSDIREGSLYCEKCGEDIHIVPDFEPEIEDTCRETIESLAKDIFNEPSDASKVNVSKKNKNKFIKPILICGIPVLFVGLLVSFFVYFRINSYDSKVGKADIAMNNSDFGQAVSIYEELLEKYPDDQFIQDKLIDALYEKRDFDRYEDLLITFSEDRDSTIQRRKKFSECLLEYYDGLEQFDKVRALLLKLDDNDLLTKYSSYFASNPRIEIKDGKYDMPQYLSFKCDGDETIYFSVLSISDLGNENIYSDEKYKEPILLSDGVFEISAYSLNSKGMRSDTVYGNIIISLTKPEQPIISPCGGDFVEPGFIEILNYTPDVDNIFYTMDGSEPTEKSRRYSGPLVILPGYYHYRFINIAANGLSSDISDAHFTFNIEWNVKVEDAISAVKYNMFENGITTSPDGNMEDGTVIGVEFTSIISLEDGFFYVLDKVAYNKYGGCSYFKEQYGVNVLTGEIVNLEEYYSNIVNEIDAF